MGVDLSVPVEGIEVPFAERTRLLRGSCGTRQCLTVTMPPGFQNVPCGVEARWRAIGQDRGSLLLDALYSWPRAPSFLSRFP